MTCKGRKCQPFQEKKGNGCKKCDDMTYICVCICHDSIPFIYFIKKIFFPFSLVWFQKDGNNIEWGSLEMKNWWNLKDEFTWELKFVVFKRKYMKLVSMGWPPDRGFGVKIPISLENLFNLLWIFEKKILKPTLRYFINPKFSIDTPRNPQPTLLPKNDFFNFLY